MRTTKDLPCKLNPAQIEERRAKAAEHGLAYSDIEARIAELKTISKGEKDKLAALAKQIRDGHETRPVKCEEVKEWNLDEVHTVRTDTKEIVERRKMTADDRQTTMGETTAKGGKRTLAAVPTPPVADAAKSDAKPKAEPKGEPH